jgi:hypothetical protein
MPDPLDVTLGLASIPSTPDIGNQQPADPGRSPGAPRAAVLPPEKEKKPETPTEKKPETPLPTPLIDVTEEYQTEDEDGNPIGTPTKVVGHGKTEIEAERDLRAKLKAVHQSAVRKMADWKKKFRTFDESKPSPTFEPLELSAEEKYRIQRELSNPETMESALDQLLQARLGVSPEDYRKKLKDEALNLQVASGSRETTQFVDEHPEFPMGPESRKAMETAFAAKSKEREDAGKAPLEWTAHNLELIFEELAESGQIAPIPPTQQEVVTVKTPVETDESDNTEELGTKIRPRGSRHSALSPEHSSVPSGAGAQPTSDETFLAEVQNMTTSALRTRIRTDQKFRQRLDSIKR